MNLLYYGDNLDVLRINVDDDATCLHYVDPLSRQTANPVVGLASHQRPQKDPSHLTA